MAQKFPSREKFLSELALNPPDITSDEAEDPLLDEDYLILSTIHSAKGQEWKVVYILNVADGWIPSDMAVGDEEQIEEERRLLYVAMTRAKRPSSPKLPVQVLYLRFSSTAGRTGTCFRPVPGLFPKQFLTFFKGTLSRKISATTDRKPGCKGPMWLKKIIGLWD